MMSSLSIQAEDTPTAQKVASGQAPQTRAPAVRKCLMLTTFNYQRIIYP